MEELINAIYLLCQKHWHPGVNSGAHELAGRIIRLIDEYRNGGQL